MSKVKPDNASPEMRDEYDFSGGIRGKYAARFAEGSRMVALDPDVAEVFSDASAVNEALRGLIQEKAKGHR